MASIHNDPHTQEHLQKLGWELRRRGWTATVYGVGIGSTLRVSHPDAIDEGDDELSASVICPPVRTEPPTMFEWANSRPIGPARGIHAAADTVQTALTIPAAGR